MKTAIVSVNRLCVLLLTATLLSCGSGSRQSNPPPPPPPNGAATFQPSYYILSLEYAPPGNESGNSYYALQTTDGTISDFNATFVGHPGLDFNPSRSGTQGAASDLGPSFAFGSVPRLAGEFQ